MKELLNTEYLKSPVTDEQITSAELKLGIKLPEDFINLMKISNGVHVKHDKTAFPVNFSIESGDEFIQVEEIMGINDEGILLSEYFSQEWDLPKNLILFSGSGHAWIGFNYQKRDIPNVVYVEPDDGNGNNFHVLADTFTEFISNLKDPDQFV